MAPLVIILYHAAVNSPTDSVELVKVPVVMRRSLTLRKLLLSLL
jgi:hypothetical protein